MASVKLSIIGSGGRMGQRIIALAVADPRFQLMAGVERPGSKSVGRLIVNGRVPIVGSVDEVLSKTDVVIDFSLPESTVKNAIQVASQRRALVIGTTGLKPAALAQLKKISKRIPIVFSPNMSVGVNALFGLVREASRLLSNYDIEIVEAHHNKKKDAPSGTAIRLAENVAAGAGRPLKKISIHSIRAGDIVGDHTVLISTAGERLELTHRAHSRDAFAAGALEAAAWVVKKKPGFYSMQDVLRRSR